MLWLGGVALIYLLWQVPHLPTWGQWQPTRSPACDFRPAWEPPGQEDQGPNSCQ